jgi:hypothetical protein
MRISLWSSFESSFTSAVDVKNRLNAPRIPYMSASTSERKSVHLPARHCCSPGHPWRFARRRLIETRLSE